MPTVSLLIGDTDQLESELEGSLCGTGLTLIRSSAVEPGAIAQDWLRDISARCDLQAEAFAYVAQALQQPVAELRAGWAARSHDERRFWLAHGPGERADPSVCAAMLALSSPPVLSDAQQSDSASRLVALLEWLPRRYALTLYVVAAPHHEALRALLMLASDHPALPLVALVEESVWPSLAESLGSRSRTLLAEGRIPTAEVEPRGTGVDMACASTSKPAGAAESTPGPNTFSVAARDFGSPELDAFAENVADLEETLPFERLEAAPNRRAPSAAELLEGARSFAEQRLFELLEADPMTSGLFALNSRMAFSFGARRAEIDLVCLELRLAIEVDGYHHFTESDAYRRDRRKDVVLQHQGFMVSRHLATDVVERGDEVVRAIRELVQRRRRTLRREAAR